MASRKIPCVTLKCRSRFAYHIWNYPIGRYDARNIHRGDDCCESITINKFFFHRLEFEMKRFVFHFAELISQIDDVVLNRTCDRSWFNKNIKKK